MRLGSNEKVKMTLFASEQIGRALSEGKPPRIASVGGFALQKKPKPSVSYPAYFPYDSNLGWHGEWFYIRNLVEAPFPPFTIRRPERRESWS